MELKYHLLFAIIALILIVTGCTTINQTQTDVKTYPSISNFYFYSIHDLKQNNFSEGSYNTEGYVVKIYTCPPCPKGALCKMCMEPNIVISEENKLLDIYSLTEKELLIFTSNSKQFELGKKYRFSINITAHKSTGEPLNDIRLLGYDIIQ